MTTYGLPVLSLVCLSLALGYVVYSMWKENRKLRMGAPKRDKYAVLLEELQAVQKQLSSEPRGLRAEVLLPHIQAMKELVVELHEAHLGARAIDRDGRYKWWGTASLVDAVNKIHERLDEQLAPLQELRFQEAERHTDALDRLHEKRAAELKIMVEKSTEAIVELKNMTQHIQDAVDSINRSRR